MMTSALHELSQLDQWVAWGNPLHDRPGKMHKAPYNPLTGCSANHSDPKTWASFIAAQQLAQSKNYHGVGFVFSDADPYAGVDLDKCIDESGQVAPWAHNIITKLNSYTEVSPSGTGVKIFCKATLKENITYQQIELYGAQRYFTVTNRHLTGTPDTINDAQDAIDQLYEHLSIKREAAKEKRQRCPRPARTAVARATTDAATSRFEQFYRELKVKHDIGEELEEMGASLVRSDQAGRSRHYSGVTNDHKHPITYVVTGDIGFSYSTHGFLNRTEHPRGFDVVTLICERDYKGNHKAMIANLINDYIPQELPTDSQINREQSYHPRDAAIQHQRQDVARKRQQRDEHRLARLQAMEQHTARIGHDNRLCERDRAVWSLHCRFFADNAQHCVSLAQIAALLCDVDIAEPKHIRRVQHANARLVEHSYLVKIEREDRRNDGKQHTNVYQPAPIERATSEATHISIQTNVVSTHEEHEERTFVRTNVKRSKNNIHVHDLTCEGVETSTCLCMPLNRGCHPDWTLRSFPRHGKVLITNTKTGAAYWYEFDEEDEAIQSTWRIGDQIKKEETDNEECLTPPSPVSSLKTDTVCRDQLEHVSAPDSTYASYNPNMAWHITGERKQLTEFERPAIMRRPGVINFGPAMPLEKTFADCNTEQTTFTKSCVTQPTMVVMEHAQPVVDVMDDAEIDKKASEFRMWYRTLRKWIAKGHSNSQIAWGYRKQREVETWLYERAPKRLQILRDWRAHKRSLDELASARPDSEQSVSKACTVTVQPITKALFSEQLKMPFAA